MHALRHSWLLIGLVTFLLSLPTGILAQNRCTPDKNLTASALRGDKGDDTWLTYSSPKNGLSFRYPPSMRVEERNPEPFHFDKAPELIVDLKGDEPNNPDLLVMRFICAPGQQTREMAAAKLGALLRTHPEKNETGRVTDGAIGSMQVDGHEAVVSCGCGRAACQYGVLILQPRECSIGMFGTNHASEPPYDGEFPVLSIINTIHFEPGVVSPAPTPHPTAATAKPDIGKEPIPEDCALAAFSRELNAALKQGDIGKVALMVRYPLRVNDRRGTYFIEDDASLRGRFADIFTPAVQNVIATQKLYRADCASFSYWYGRYDVYIVNRDMMYAIEAVNVPGGVGSVGVHVPVLFTCVTDQARMIVDVGPDGEPRYRAWELQHPLTLRPDTELLHGKASIEGTGACAYSAWSFKDGDKRLSLEDVECHPLGEEQPPTATGAQFVRPTGTRSWCLRPESVPGSGR